MSIKKGFSNELYQDSYSKLLYSGLLGRLSAFPHFLMEFHLRNLNLGKVIELGAGSGEHRRFVKHSYTLYLETDLNKSLTNSSVVQMNAEKLDLIEDSSYDRLIATCLLAHLANPEQALLEWRRVVKPGGIISIYVPCEPGVILRLFRFLTTNIKARRQGYDHYAIHYVEHRNYYISMKYMIKSVFKLDSIKRVRFPLPLLSWNFNFFEIYQIRVGVSQDESQSS